MKSMIIAFALLVTSSQSFALSANDSWQKIRHTPNVILAAQTVAFAAGDAVIFVPVLDVCILNADQFMTVEPQNIIQVVTQNYRTREVAVGRSRLIGSNKAKTVPKIDSGDNNSTEAPFLTVIPTIQKVDVMFKNSSSSAVKLFTKKFTIPNCQ